MRITNFTEISKSSEKFNSTPRFNSRVSGEISAVDGLNQLFRHLDDLLPSQSDSVVFVDVVGRVVRLGYRRVLGLLVR